MDRVLQALGRPSTVWWQIWFVSIIALWTTSFLAIGYAVVELLGIHPALFHGLVWMAWLIWLGFLFPLTREREIRKGAERAYQRAFYKEVLNGVACSFSQMLRPALYGLLAGPSFAPPLWQFCLGLSIFIAGVTLVIMGVRVIGIGGAIFVLEYDNLAPQLLQKGVYKYVRHPMFIGSVAASFGTAVMANNPHALAMGLITIAVLPIYRQFEDARCLRIFRAEYSCYKATAGSFFPKLRLSARLRDKLQGDRA